MRGDVTADINLKRNFTAQATCRRLPTHNGPLHQKMPRTLCYFSEILIATTGSVKENCKLVSDVLRILDVEGLTKKWGKFKFLIHNIELLVFKIDKKEPLLWFIKPMRSGT